MPSNVHTIRLSNPRWANMVRWCIVLYLVFSLSSKAQSLRLTPPLPPIENMMRQAIDLRDTEHYSIAGSLSKYHQAQLYTLYGRAGQQLRLHMHSDTLDSLLVVLSNQGSVQASNDDSVDAQGSYSLDARLETQLPYSGLYFVLATSFTYIDGIIVPKDPTTAHYGLEVEVLANPEAPRDFIGLSQLPSDIPQRHGYQALGLRHLRSLKPELQPPLALHYYFFDGHLGDEIEVELHSQDFDSLLQIFAPSGRRVASSDDALHEGHNAHIYNFVLPETGRYIIMASDVFFYNAQDKHALLQPRWGSYQLRFAHERP